MKICNICGTENDDDAIFCQGCLEKMVDDDTRYKLRFNLQGDDKHFSLNDGDIIGSNGDSELNKYLSVFPNISKNFCSVYKKEDKWYLKNISKGNWFMVGNNGSNKIVESNQESEINYLDIVSFARVSFVCDFIEEPYEIEEEYYIKCPFGQINLTSINEKCEKCSNCQRKAICQNEVMVKKVKRYAD